MGNPMTTSESLRSICPLPSKRQPSKCFGRAQVDQRYPAPQRQVNQIIGLHQKKNLDHVRTTRIPMYRFETKTLVLQRIEPTYLH
jgi:hypothetical protein